MKKRKYFLVLLFLFISSVIYYFIYNASLVKQRLTVFQPAEVNPELVDDSLQWVKKFHTIKPFELTNQNGKTFYSDYLNNKIYVADFIFTTCPTICPKMTGNMKLLQNQFRQDSLFKLVSFSVTPEIDSVEVLKKYAIEKGVNDSVWNLLTGDRKTIYELARKSYFTLKKTNDDEPMIHTENFVLVDKNRKIRGYYDGTSVEEMQKLISDINILKAEKKNVKENILFNY